MRISQRLLALTLVWSAAVALALGGPVHFLLAHCPAGDHGHAHHHAEAAGCHEHDGQPESDDPPVDHSSHECSVCVLLSIGGTLPTCETAAVNDRPSFAAPVLFELVEVSTGDQQLPAARAPPAPTM